MLACLPARRATAAGIVAVGIWLIVSPAVIDHGRPLMVWNDVGSGAIAAAAGLAALGRGRAWAAWIAGAVGFWLLFAPVAFWAPTFASYTQDILAGIALVTLGLLVPLGQRLPGETRPPGWSYNPSSWSQRTPVLVLATIAYVAAAYLAAFQLGYTDTAWDPLFGDGTRRVLTSDVSRAWPVSDAALGATTYLLDMLMTIAGDRRRWRTMPWLVITFGVLIIPMGIVSITLVILQPVAVGAWCSPCLLTALLTLLMIPLALDEVISTLQVVRRAHQRGEAWRVLWRGSHVEPETVPPPAGPVVERGASWPLVIAAVVGMWLLAAPSVLGTSGVLADSTRIVGAAIAVVGVIAFSEVGRPLRFANVPLALWIGISPWFLGDASELARGQAALAAIVVIALSVPRGPIKDRHGSYDRVAAWAPVRT